MNRRSLILSIALVPALLGAPAALAQDERISLSELSRYFNSFEVAEAEFTQVNPDESISTGQLMIHRPGRVRFEYDPPEENLVLASGGSVNIFDARSNQGPTVYPLRRTPLNLILAEEVDLSRERMVVDHRAEGPTTIVVAQDPENPDYGTIELVFSADPIELRQWIVTDDMGRETTVILGDLELGGSLSSTLFSVDIEMQRRGLRSGQ
ncbi:MAG: Outer membrane lipoprotein-sorting protein [Rhodobacteraceae bacterium HLUCCA12]|nr:MAG: Outer membrane lipoprotein-sorting protein [Rhodobacteraceae bacterium HLUCCA12]